MLTTAVAMIVSALYPRFRDTGDHLGRRCRRRCSTRRRCCTRSRSCPGTLRDLLALNPLAPLFELARKWVIDPDAPGPAAPPAAAALLPAVAIFVAVCVLAVWVFSREAPRIAEEL